MILAGVSLSMKITESPGAMLVTPFNPTARPKTLQLSSIFQPEISTTALPILVTSNQSVPSGLLPLDQGATSEMMMEPVPVAATVTDKRKSTLASGLPATAGSFTLTVT